MALVDVTLTDLARRVHSDGLVLVECHSRSCPACRAFRPLFESAAARHLEHTFARIDVQAEDDAGSVLRVTHTPTLMVFRDGFLLFREAGHFSEAQLEDVVRQATSLDMDLVRASPPPNHDLPNDDTGELPMTDSTNTHKQELGIKWIRAESGRTYLCPVGALDRVENPSEQDLREFCVDESRNPHNE